MTFCVPCLFGLEGLVADELRRLNLQNVRAQDRRVFFDGEFADMARANLCCRMGERVMILLGQFEARSFEELFQGVKALPLEQFIPKDGAFPVKGYSLDSQLHSVPDCQAIIKKAAVTRLQEKYGLGWMPETGATYQLRFSIMKDAVEVFLDTSGVSLHKRGYRAVANLAPLHETMAAAMVNLSRYRGRDFFWDPFCGSGTICIEAALIAINRAPGLGRNFESQKWSCVPETVWQQARTEAMDREYHGEYHILGTDTDPRVAGDRAGERPQGGRRPAHRVPRGRRHEAAAAGGVGRSRLQPALRRADARAAQRPAALSGARTPPALCRQVEESTSFPPSRSSSTTSAPRRPRSGSSTTDACSATSTCITNRLFLNFKRFILETILPKEGSGS
jgi:putative N6-adenine-specific DNA methylase